MSCVDYIQSISYKGGKYHLYYKVTFSKILMELAEEDVDDPPSMDSALLPPQMPTEALSTQNMPEEIQAREPEEKED